MSVIKPRTRGKHVVEHRTRLDRENHETLYAYAAFLNEDVDYVLNQVIAIVLERDRDFAAWRAEHRQAYAPDRALRTAIDHRRRRSTAPKPATAEPERPAVLLRQ